MDEIAAVGAGSPRSSSKQGKMRSELKFADPEGEKCIKRERELLNQVNFLFKKLAKIRSKVKGKETSHLQTLETR